MYIYKDSMMNDETIKVIKREMNRKIAYTGTIFMFIEEFDGGSRSAISSLLSSFSIPILFSLPTRSLLLLIFCL